MTKDIIQIAVSSLQQKDSKTLKHTQTILTVNIYSLYLYTITASDLLVYDVVAMFNGVGLRTWSISVSAKSDYIRFIFILL